MRHERGNRHQNRLCSCRQRQPRRGSGRHTLIRDLDLKPQDIDGPLAGTLSVKCFSLRFSRWRTDLSRRGRVAGMDRRGQLEPPREPGGYRPAPACGETMVVELNLAA